MLNFDQTCILIYKNPQKHRFFEKLPLPYFIWKSINQPLKSPKYGWLIDFQLKYGRGIFSKILFILIFLFLYIKMHVWSKFNNKIQRKGLVEHPFPFCEIPAKYAYLSVILWNGNGLFYQPLFWILLLNFDQICILIYENKNIYIYIYK